MTGNTSTFPGSVRVQPTGSFRDLSRSEVDQLLDASSPELRALFRGCALAVMNGGAYTDDAHAVFDTFRDFRIEAVQEYRGIELEVTGGMNRPAYKKDEKIGALFEHAKSLAAEVGFELEDVVMTGGGSDGNFTAALGVPTLDGLGADGYGAHSDYEHIYYSSLEPRTKLMLLLFQTLT